jgi:hypothetical protein
LNIIQAVGRSTGLPLTLGIMQFPGVVNVLHPRHRLDGGAAPAGEYGAIVADVFPGENVSFFLAVAVEIATTILQCEIL